jgi:hypothetical protein
MKAVIMLGVRSCFVSMCMLASTGMADGISWNTHPLNDKAYPPRTYSIRPCNSWTYDSSSFGYVCGFLDRWIDVTDARDVAMMARTIEDLQARVADLTRRIEALEAR